MIISDHDLDKLICEIIADCEVVTPPLDRGEIAQHVLDHVSHGLRKEVYAALDRMASRGAVVRHSIEGEEARVWRYALPDSSAARH